MAAWVCVGLAAERTASPSVSKIAATPGAPPVAPPWQPLTDANLARIRFDDLPPDDGLVAPLAANDSGLDAAGRSRLDSIRDKLAHWPPAAVNDPEQRVRNLLSVCTVADLAEDENEAEIARTVLDQIQAGVPADVLKKVLAWVTIHPAGGSVITDVSGFGIAKGPTKVQVPW